MTSRLASSSPLSDTGMTTSTSSSSNSNTQALAFAVAALQQSNNNHDVNSMDDDAAQRLQRSRERNREHARRTRLRKKAHLQALQVKCRALQEEQKGLRQKLEDRRVADILLGLSTISPSMNTPTVTSSLTEPTTETDTSTNGPPSKRAKTSSQSEGGVLSILVDGVSTTFSRRSHINWKTGLYTDVTSGHQRRLSPQHLEALRRERNRMHAKMTRDRKKCFIKTIEATIEELENENARLRHQIESKQDDDGDKVLTVVTPVLSATESPPTTTSHGFVLE